MNEFAIWLGIGTTIGLWRLVRSVPAQQAETWVNTGLIVLAAALAGSRLGFAANHWGYYSAHLLEIPQVWLGGLDGPGAVIGAWLALLALALSSPRRLFAVSRQFADQLYPLLPPIAVTTWLGLWQAGAAYGPALPGGQWWGVPSLDESGVYNQHMPLQPLAALSLLVFFITLEARVKPLQPAGRLSGAAFGGLLLHMLVISLLRADPAPTWRGLPMNFWEALLLLIVLVTFAGISSLTHSRRIHHWLNIEKRSLSKS